MKQGCFYGSNSKRTPILNLEPKKIMGIKSNGMILMAENAEGLSLVNVPENAKPGDIVN